VEDWQDFNPKDTDNGHEKKLLGSVRRRKDSWNRLRGLMRHAYQAFTFSVVVMDGGDEGM
jgi:hypothetical protein